MLATFVSPRVLLSLCLASGCALLVAACGNKDPMAAKIVATVDGAEINLRQMNALLAKAQDITPDNITKAKLEILGGLVEQQLAMNLAINNKLDRKPEIVNAIEASRREILARAAMDQIAADLPQVGEEEAKRYYAEHPALYAERRTYTLQQFEIRKPAPEADKLRAQLASAKRMDDVASWLKERKLDFSTSESTKSAEQLAPEMLARLQSFKDGQIGLIETSDAYTVVHLLSSRPQPPAANKTLPSIITLLSSQHAAAAIKQAKLDMKTNAKLEYLGEFAGAEAAFKSGKETVTKSAVDEDAQIKARAKAEATVVEQGIKGL